MVTISYALAMNQLWRKRIVFVRVLISKQKGMDRRHTTIHCKFESWWSDNKSRSDGAREPLWTAMYGFVRSVRIVVSHWRERKINEKLLVCVLVE